MTTCRVCNTQTEEIFSHLVLNKYEVKYYRCPTCLFVQTEQPYWLEEAYKNAINITDTGILKRNERFRAVVSMLLFCFYNKTQKYLDYAGGYGIFTRMMRDVGFNFYWLDPYAKNLLAIGFEHQLNQNYHALTAFEVFEHLPEPITEIEQMVAYSNTIIFSTRLIPDTLPEKSWWYYGFNHGQHVGLFHIKTLNYIANKFKLNLYTDGAELHLLTPKKLNRFLVKIAFKFSKWGGYWIINHLIQSKTDSDHHELLKNIKHGN